MEAFEVLEDSGSKKTLVIAKFKKQEKRGAIILFIGDKARLLFFDDVPDQDIEGTWKEIVSKYLNFFK